MKRPLALRIIVAWSAFCAIWMIYIVTVDSLALARGGDIGGYGIFVDRKLLIMVSTMPLELVSTITLMGAGRKAALAVEILSALTYCLVAFGLWRDGRIARAVSGGFFILGFVLLGAYVGYIVPVGWALWGSEHGLFAVSTGTIFLLANGWVVFYLFRNAKRLAPSTA